MSGIQMDYTTVNVLAEEFGLVADELMALLQKIDEDIILLESEAFTGLVGSYVASYHNDIIRPEFDSLSLYCQQLSDDLHAAVAAVQSGDTSGSARFAL